MINNPEPKWPKQRKIKWLMNTITIIVVISLIGTLMFFGKTLIYKYENICLSLIDAAHPYLTHHTILLRSPLVIKDVINHDYDKYHESLYKRVSEKNMDVDNYQMYHAIELNIEDSKKEVNGKEEITQLTVCLELQRNGLYGQGCISYNCNTNQETQELPIYTIQKDGWHAVYMKINNRWVKFDINDEVESVITLSPQKIIKNIQNADFVDTPSNILRIRPNGFDYGVYKFMSVNGCIDAAFNNIPIVFHSDATNKDKLYGISSERNASLNHKALIEFAEQKNDKVILHILKNHTVLYGTMASAYQSYGEIPEIEIPDEVFEDAQYITNQDIEVLQQQIIDEIERGISDG
ncbi:MAG: hypothetical protein IJ419_13845 [Agathobacter sp.]|nr:hypothetical protein [Agathobacter sp.]